MLQIDPAEQNWCEFQCAANLPQQHAKFWSRSIENKRKKQVKMLSLSVTTLTLNGGRGPLNWYHSVECIAIVIFLDRNWFTNVLTKADVIHFSPQPPI